MYSLKRARQGILKAKNILIASHINPDGDSIGMKKDTLVICPVYNEGETIREFYRRLRKHYKGDALFIDDGSKDNSRVFLLHITDKKTFVLRHPKRKGYGAALISSFEYSLKHNYKRVITIDVDLQHSPRHIPQFLAALKRYKVVLGSRYIRIDSYLEAPLTRMLINRHIATIINAFFSAHFTDPFCGLRGYRDSFLKKARLREKGYAFALDVLLEIMRTKTPYKEIPVEIVYTNKKRKFLNGLNDPQKRLNYYIDFIVQNKKEFNSGQKKIPIRKPAP